MGQARTLERLAGNDPCAGAGDLVRGRVDDIVLVITVPEASVGSVTRVPCACVERTVSTEGDLVLSEDVRVVEVARLVLAIRARVCLLVLSLSLACGSAEGGIVGVIVEEAHAIVGVVSTVKGCRDTSWERDACLEVLDTWESLVALAVTIATGDHDVESLAVSILRTTPLTLIGSSLACNRITVERALNISNRFGVGATIFWLKFRIAFVEDVEAQAVGLAITGIGAALDIVGIILLEG